MTCSDCGYYILPTEIDGGLLYACICGWSTFFPDVEQVYERGDLDND